MLEFSLECLDMVQPGTEGFGADAAYRAGQLRFALAQRQEHHTAPKGEAVVRLDIPELGQREGGLEVDIGRGRGIHAVFSLSRICARKAVSALRMSA
ncbi:hypothetical protein D3C86_1968180 [compost metagenome]